VTTSHEATHGAGHAENAGDHAESATGAQCSAVTGVARGRVTAGGDELVVDLFAGGGGASTGILEALGRHPDIAVNHSAAALAVHEANHPTTTHYREDVFDVNPRRVCGDRPVGLLWMSPDCTHFSKAKGGKPRSKGTRSLAWVAIRWASEVRPRVIVLENVEEFVTWGPLCEAGQPIVAKKGETFAEWRRALEALGYHVEHRLLVAADYGAPTTRKRLFLVARCDGAPIVWPTPTHGRGRVRPWRTAAEIIDWTIPCPSIFGRPKPLAEATQARIAEGVRRYVLETARPFIVSYYGASSAGRSVDAPLPTATTRDRFALISPTLIQTGYGEREGQAPRVPGLHKPLGTVVAGAAKHAVVAAFLTKHYGVVIGHEIDRPIGTVTTQDHHSLTTATLEPASPDRREQARAFLAAHGCERRERTLFDAGRDGLVTVGGVRYEIADIGMRMLVPRELFRAQGFPDDYKIEVEHEGRVLPKTAQIALAGNSVCPALAAAIVRANMSEPLAYAEAAE
jgi:DNA (cytosine-5)-methyltransferase 1